MCKALSTCLECSKRREVEKCSSVYRIEDVYGWAGIDESLTPFVSLALCRRLGGRVFIG